MTTHDLTLDMTLKAIHTMDAGTHVELKFVVQPSGDCDGGDLTLRLTPVQSVLYMLGDRIFVHVRTSG